MAKYLDLEGLTTFWGKVKEWAEGKLAGKADTGHTHANYATKTEVTNITNGTTKVGKAGTADTATTATTAQKTTAALVLKVKTGQTEGTDLYTFNGSTAKTLDIKAGSNVTLTPAADALTIAATNTTYAIATATTAGLVKPASVITKPTIQAASTTAGKYYHVQMSSDGNMFVNVPWTDTNTTYDLSGYLKSATAESTYMKKTDVTTITTAEIEALFTA